MTKTCPYFKIINSESYIFWQEIRNLDKNKKTSDLKEYCAI